MHSQNASMTADINVSQKQDTRLHNFLARNLKQNREKFDLYLQEL